MSMPHSIVSGGTGLVGRFIVEALLTAGHRVTIMGMTRKGFGGAISMPALHFFARQGPLGFPERCSSPRALSMGRVRPA